MLNVAFLEHTVTLFLFLQLRNVHSFQNKQFQVQPNHNFIMKTSLFKKFSHKFAKKHKPI